MEEHFGTCFDSDESDFDVGSLGKHATCKNNNDKKICADEDDLDGLGAEDSTVLDGN